MADMASDRGQGGLVKHWPQRLRTIFTAGLHMTDVAYGFVDLTKRRCEPEPGCVGNGKGKKILAVKCSLQKYIS